MATPATQYYTPGPGNVYVPAATAQVQVEFSRNPESFPLARYLQIIPTDKLAGFYPVLDTDEAIRVVTQDDYLWPDGQERPKGTTRPLKWQAYTCRRRAYSFSMGTLTVDQADFDAVAANSRMDATKCMTDRAIDAITVLTTAGNWDSASTAATLDALGVTSGSWDTSTTTNQFIKKSFNLVKQAIAKNTGGVVRPGDVKCIVNPTRASTMGETAEILSYMTQHEQALGVLQGADRRIVDDYGLPPYLYGVEMVVEDTVKVSARRDVDTQATPAYAFGSDVAVFCSRVGGLEGPPTNGDGNAAPSYSTLIGFFQEEMSIEGRTDDWNRLTEGSVVDTRDIVLAAGASGYFLQDVTT